MSYAIQEVKEIKAMSGGENILLGTPQPHTCAVMFRDNDSNWRDQANNYAIVPKSCNVYLLSNITRKGQLSNSITAFFGIYVDMVVNFGDTLNADFIAPTNNWAVLYNTSVSLNDTKSDKGFSFSIGDEWGTYKVGVPGTLLESTVEFNSKGKYSAQATYRYWLCSNNALILSSDSDVEVSVYLNGVNTYKVVALKLDSNIPIFNSVPSEIYDEENFTIGFTFSLSLSRIEYLEFGIEDKTYKEVVEYKSIPIATSYTYIWNDEDSEKIYNRFNTTNIAPVYLCLKYKNFNEEPRTIRYLVNLSINPIPPTMEVTLSDNNNILPNTEEVFVNLLSDLKVTLNPIAYKGAYIEYYGVEYGGEDVMNQNEVIFQEMNSQRVFVYCVDSRGNTFSQTYALDGWIPYILPTCSIAADPPNTDGLIPITLHGRYFNKYFTAFTNSYSFYYKCTSNNPDHSIDWTLLQSPPVITVDDAYYFSTAFNITVPDHVDTYSIQVQFRDKYSSYTSNTITVKAKPVFDWGLEDFNFNVPVNIVGDLTVSGTISSNTPVEKDPDYIVEQGTVTTGSGNSAANWVYRKWNSGIAECWCRKHISTAVNTAWGNLFVSGALSYTNITWGVDFIEIPVANITIAPNASGAFLIAGGSTSLTKDNTGGYEIARGSALASAGSFYINYYGIGRWK